MSSLEEGAARLAAMDYRSISVSDSDLDVPDDVRKLLGEMPPGPLDSHRSSASFDRYRMSTHVHGAPTLRQQYDVWSSLEQDPLGTYTRGPGPASMPDEKAEAFRRTKRLFEFQVTTSKHQDEALHMMMIHAVNMVDMNLVPKFFLSRAFFEETIESLGSKRHDEVVIANSRFDICGCFAMTEMRHGSNTRFLQTTATYDPKTRQFVINTPEFADCKMWSGNLGYTATHAIVFAQLILPNGENKGLHVFIVPLRNPNTLCAYPGVILGEMGEKISAQGIDNGFAIFKNVRIPKDNLLNRVGDVTDDGEYVSNIKQSSQRFGENIGFLTLGRINVASLSVSLLRMMTTVAVRYSAVRRQFGTPGEEEVEILCYKTHLRRLMPCVAATFVHYHFIRDLYSHMLSHLVAKYMGVGNKEYGAELHALSCGAKAIMTWAALRCAQECREACGGHGYLSANRLGEFRDASDAYAVFDGDNNVICQVVSTYCLQLAERVLDNGEQVKTEMGSGDLMNMLASFKADASDARLGEMTETETVIQMMQWLVRYLTQKTRESVDKEVSERVADEFWSRSNSEAMLGRELAEIFTELGAVRAFKQLCDKAPADLKPVLLKLGALHGLVLCEKYVSVFFEGGYFKSGGEGVKVRNAIMEICGDLRPEAVTLVDVMAPTDFILDSPIGRSNGDIYRNMFSRVLQAPATLERASWWREFLDKPDVQSRGWSKL